MTVARSVADVLDDHVVFEVESIDRMYLNVWQPRLAYGGGVQGFFVGHRGSHYASTALMDPMTKAFVADIHGFVAARGLELVSFAKGQRKDDLAQEFLAKFTDEEGVLFVGRAQEKAGVWRTQRRYSPSTGGSYAWLVRASAFINFFYFYCVDADFGPFFLKFSTYFPYTAKLCINGNEWAKRQAAKAGIRFEPLDNGFASCQDVPAVQAICDSLGPEHIDALLRKWLAILPHPFSPEDETAGYRYELSILQAEFSLTQMLRRRAATRGRRPETARAQKRGWSPMSCTREPGRAPCRQRLRRPAHRAEHPRRHVPGREHRQRAVDVVRRQHGHHPDAHVERLLHLRALDPAAGGDQAEHRRGRPAAPLDHGLQPGRQHPLEVAGQPAAGDVRERAHPRLGGDREAVAGVDPGGGQQLLAEGVAELLDVAVAAASGRCRAARAGPASSRWSADRTPTCATSTSPGRTRSGRRTWSASTIPIPVADRS